MVSPLDPKGVELVEDYRNLIHAPTSAEWQYAELINWLADEKQAEDRIILVTEKGVSPTAAASYLKESGLPYSTLSYGILEGRNIVETLNGMMTKEGVNRVVVACEHEAFLVDVVRNLNLLIHRKNQVVLYGPARIRSYDNTIDIENLHNLNLHVCTSYYVDYDSEPVKAFLPAYRALFRCEPSPFAYQGYDILTYFVNLISRQGDDWPSALGKRREAGLQADFLFSQVEQGGFANEAVRRIIYEPDFTIRLVR